MLKLGKANVTVKLHEEGYEYIETLSKDGRSITLSIDPSIRKWNGGQVNAATLLEIFRKWEEGAKTVSYDAFAEGVISLANLDNYLQTGELPGVRIGVKKAKPVSLVAQLAHNSTRFLCFELGIDQVLNDQINLSTKSGKKRKDLRHIGFFIDFQSTLEENKTLGYAHVDKIFDLWGNNIHIFGSETIANADRYLKQYFQRLAEDLSVPNLSDDELAEILPDSGKWEIRYLPSDISSLRSPFTRSCLQSMNDFSYDTWGLPPEVEENILHLESYLSEHPQDKRWLELLTLYANSGAKYDKYLDFFKGLYTTNVKTYAITRRIVADIEALQELLPHIDLINLGKFYGEELAKLKIHISSYPNFPMESLQTYCDIYTRLYGKSVTVLPEDLQSTLTELTAKLPIPVPFQEVVEVGDTQWNFQEIQDRIEWETVLDMLGLGSYFNYSQPSGVHRIKITDSTNTHMSLIYIDISADHYSWYGPNYQTITNAQHREAVKIWLKNNTGQTLRD